MPSIKEIIAAKEAAKAAALAAQAAATSGQQLSSPLSAGKPPGRGIVLTKDLPKGMENGEPRGQRTEIQEELTLPERRNLCEPEGETLPMTPVNATPEVAAWHAAMMAFETELCLMRDPLNPEHAWLAVRFSEQPSCPILLHKLPFYEHPRTVRPENEPF